jgi:hypothetical protein
MHSEAIEGLLEEDVLAESSLPIETPAAIGSGEQAHRQGQRIRQGEGGIVRGLSQQFLPEELFSLPQVRCLPAEGGAMHTSEVREEVGVVASEVPKELFVFIYAQKLADDLYGKHLRVAQRGGGSTCSEAPEVLDVVVYEAEDSNDEGAKIHNRRPPLRLSGAIGIGSTPSVGRSSLSLKSSKKLAHGVS